MKLKVLTSECPTDQKTPWVALLPQRKEILENQSPPPPSPFCLSVYFPPKLFGFFGTPVPTAWDRGVPHMIRRVFPHISSTCRLWNSCLPFSGMLKTCTAHARGWWTVIPISLPNTMWAWASMPALPNCGSTFWDLTEQVMNLSLCDGCVLPFEGRKECKQWAEVQHSEVNQFWCNFMHVSKITLGPRSVCAEYVTDLLLSPIEQMGHFCDRVFKGRTPSFLQVHWKG